MSLLYIFGSPFAVSTINCPDTQFSPALMGTRCFVFRCSDKRIPVSDNCLKGMLKKMKLKLYTRRSDISFLCLPEYACKIHRHARAKLNDINLEAFGIAVEQSYKC